MAQPMVCDNHSDEPVEAIMLLTQVPTGEVAKFCPACWPLAFAAMIGALEPDDCAAVLRTIGARMNDGPSADTQPEPHPAAPIDGTDAKPKRRAKTAAAAT